MCLRGFNGRNRCCHLKVGLEDQTALAVTDIRCNRNSKIVKHLLCCGRFVERLVFSLGDPEPVEQYS
jgi:hypothetical protein